MNARETLAELAFREALLEAKPRGTEVTAPAGYRNVILAELQAEISDVLVRHIEPLFKPGMALTLIARRPGKPDQTVIVSSDDIPAVVTETVIASTKEPRGANR